MWGEVTFDLSFAIISCMSTPKEDLFGSPGGNHLSLYILRISSTTNISLWKSQKYFTKEVSWVL